MFFFFKDWIEGLKERLMMVKGKEGEKEGHKCKCKVLLCK